jgi:hypothetical protein
VIKRFAPNDAPESPCAPTSRPRWPPELPAAPCSTPRRLRRRPHPEPQRGLPEGPAAAQGQPVDRHLLRRRGPHPGAGLRAPGRGADAGRERPQALPADRRGGAGAQAPCRSCCSAPITRRAQRPRRDAADRRLQRRAQGRCGLLKRWFPGSGVWVSDPTWDNHRAMFEGAGLAVHTYPYYDAATGGLRFDAMLQTRCARCQRSVVLLHACCHNPTGVDLPHPVGGADPGAAGAPTAALPGPGLPGLW